MKTRKNFKAADDRILKKHMKNASSTGVGLERAATEMGRTLNSVQSRWSRLQKRNRKPKKAAKKTVIHNRVPQQTQATEDSAYYVDLISLMLPKLTREAKILLFRKLTNL